MYIGQGRNYPFVGMKMDSNSQGLAGTTGYCAFFSEGKIFDFMQDVKNLALSIDISWIEPGFPADDFKSGRMSTLSRRANPGFGWFNAFATNPPGARDKDMLGVRHFAVITNSGQINVRFVPTLHNHFNSTGPSSQPLFWPIFEFSGSTNGAQLSGGSPTSNDGSVDITGLSNEFGEIGSNLFLNATVPGNGSATGFAITGTGRVIEVYSQIFSDKDVARVGDSITFTCPPYTSRFGAVHDHSSRDGFKYVKSIWFGGEIPVDVTSAMLSTSSSESAPTLDQLTVTVPAGAKTGPIRFVSKFTNENLPDEDRTESDKQRDDYFNTRFDLMIR
jgi:hypothetical protein